MEDGEEIRMELEVKTKNQDRGEGKDKCIPSHSDTFCKVSEQILAKLTNEYVLRILNWKNDRFWIDTVHK